MGNEKTVGSFLHRVYDDIQNQSEEEESKQELVEAVKNLRDEISELRQKVEAQETDDEWVEVPEDGKRNKFANDSDETLFLCTVETHSDGRIDGTIKETEQEIREYIEETYDATPVINGNYEERPVQELKIGGDNSFQETERSMPELSKQDRKDIVHDWFQNNSETRATVKSVAKQVFGQENVDSGTAEYNMVYNILEDLSKEEILERERKGTHNEYTFNKQTREVTH